MNFIKGVLIGITMMIPGLSGGSCAMVLNVYDKMMNAVTNIFNFKQMIFCLKIGLGILSGILFFSFFLYKFTLFSYFSYIVLFIIIINILLLFKEYKSFKIKYILLISLGYLMMFILNNLTIKDIEFNLITYFIIGLLLAISLILPGLGASYVLYILNLYDKLNTALINFDIVFLLLISLSTLIGTFLSANIINTILKKDKFIIYSVVIGLLLGGI